MISISWERIAFSSDNLSNYHSKTISNERIKKIQLKNMVSDLDQHC